jgi:hypothetical protein
VAINWRLARSATSENPATVLEIPHFITSDPSARRFKLIGRIEKVTAPAAVVAPQPVEAGRA